MCFLKSEFGWIELRFICFELHMIWNPSHRTSNYGLTWVGSRVGMGFGVLDRHHPICLNLCIYYSIDLFVQVYSSIGGNKQCTIFIGSVFETYTRSNEWEIEPWLQCHWLNQKYPLWLWYMSSKKKKKEKKKFLSSKSTVRQQQKYISKECSFI